MSSHSTLELTQQLEVKPEMFYFLLKTWSTKISEIGGVCDSAIKRYALRVILPKAQSYTAIQTSQSGNERDTLHISTFLEMWSYHCIIPQCCNRKDIYYYFSYQIRPPNMTLKCTCLSGHFPQADGGLSIVKLGSSHACTAATYSSVCMCVCVYVSLCMIVMVSNRLCLDVSLFLSACDTRENSTEETFELFSLWTNFKMTKWSEKDQMEMKCTVSEKASVFVCIFICIYVRVCLKVLEPLCK